MSNALLHALSLLNDLQTERGIALLPMQQLGQVDTPSFDQQSNLTHEALAKTQKNYPDFWALLPERFFNAFAQRTNADFRINQTQDQLREWYTFNLEHPIHQMVLSYLTNDDHFSPSQMSALIHYIAAFGYLNQLRDLGVIVYTKAEITPTDSSRLKNAAASYLARERLFLGLADDNLRQIIDEAQNAFTSTSAEIDEVIRKIKNGYTKGVLASTPMPAWIEGFNRELIKLQDALGQSIKKLTHQAQELAATGTPNQSLDSDIEHNLHTIRTLPLFRGLSEASLRNILKGARLMDLEKNATFMTQGEGITRFYILMDGWAKTTKMTAEGQEAIVQILGKKECLVDIGYINASMASLNGRTISKCRVLALSLAVFRDHASRNRELAQNLLTATTLRLQKMVSQYEQMTLRNATQRVGWFLVNLHLETGLDGAPLKLPFDKALIATYLNIKPETFSRVLKVFQKQGFIINKDEIILPSPKALCAYCDPELALRCCRAEATNCVPIQTTRRAERK
ncbi:MAG: Crp/Fnr family transcriptional regulator [Alphaproteobacteria bacterium]|nr:Crp/Fnr family transcriptional regulator [Alphaproteobacteria bacterium]